MTKEEKEEMDFINKQASKVLVGIIIVTVIMGIVAFIVKSM